MPRTQFQLSGRWKRLSRQETPPSDEPPWVQSATAGPLANAADVEADVATEGQGMAVDPDPTRAVVDDEAAPSDLPEGGQVVLDNSSTSDTTANQSHSHSMPPPLNATAIETYQPLQSLETGPNAGFMFKAAKDPERSVFIFDLHYFAGVEQKIVDILVRNAWQLDPKAHGGARDQRSMDGQAMKSEAGMMSTVKGYARQAGTRWMVAEHVGLVSQRALTFDELFDLTLMVEYWQTGKEGRPPVPEARVGTQLLEKIPEQKEALTKLAWKAVEAKRITNPEAAAEG